MKKIWAVGKDYHYSKYPLHVVWSWGSSATQYIPDTNQISIHSGKIPEPPDASRL